MKSRIYLVIARPDGRESVAEIEGDPITEPMRDAAEDLLETLTTGERPPLKGLYDLCAQAFNTSRDDAKERIAAAAYGMSETKIQAKSEGRGAVLARLLTTRRERSAAHAEVVSWMDDEGARRGTSPRNEEAPGWGRFTRAEIAYGYAIRNLEAWLDAEIGA
jgi:hypothetical protein